MCKLSIDYKIQNHVAENKQNMNLKATLILDKDIEFFRKIFLPSVHALQQWLNKSRQKDYSKFNSH